MEIATAVAMIEKGIDRTGPAQLWADLGAGSGLFSRALSMLLPDNSIIYAIDKNKPGLSHIKSNNPAIQIIPVQQDFTEPLNIRKPPDGILMANSLHYVQTASVFLQQLVTFIKPGGSLIIIEYDTATANRWVPYPVNYERLVHIIQSTGLGKIKKIAEQPSLFRSGGMYAAVISVGNTLA